MVRDGEDASVLHLSIERMSDPVFPQGLLLLASLALAVPVATAGQARSNPPEWRTILEWEVGDLDGPLALTVPTDLLVAPDGRIFVTQPRTHDVWVLGPDGTLRGVIGREGRGPGEFESPERLYWRGDTLAVWDLKLHRVSLFSRQGNFLRTLPAPVWSAQLGFLGKHSIVAVPAMLTPRVSGRPKDRVLRRLDLHALKIDTLAFLPQPHRILHVEYGNGYYNGLQPFSDDPLWAAAPDGRSLVIVERNVERLPPDPTFTVTVFDTAGRARLSRQIPFEPVPFDEAAADAAAEDRSARMRRSLERAGLSGRPFPPRVIRKALYMPPVYPPVERVVIGHDGTLWLARESVPGAAYVTWWVLDPAANPVGVVRLSPDFRGVLRPAGDRLVAVRVDELDVVHLARFRLVRR